MALFNSALDPIRPLCSREFAFYFYHNRIASTDMGLISRYHAGTRIIKKQEKYLPQLLVNNIDIKYFPIAVTETGHSSCRIASLRAHYEGRKL